ncbi:unnamed protein product, partial [Meganyctiphanes norvegica]
MHLVVLVLTLLVSSAHGNSSPAGWVLDDGLMVGMEEIFGNPFHRALETLPALLGDEYLNSTSLDLEALLSKNDTAKALFPKALRYYLPSPFATGNVSLKCRQDVSLLLTDQTILALNDPLKDLENHKFWKNASADSWGKFPDGIMSGNWMPLGMMEECTTVITTDGKFYDSNIKAHFNGKYCLVSHSVWWDPALRVGSPAVSGNIPNPILGGPTYGTCMPDSCSAEDFKVSLEEVLPEGKKVHSVHCHTKDEQLDWQPKDVWFVSIFGILVFTVICSAAVDLTISYYPDAQHLRKGYLRYFLAFSAYSNMSKIFHINTKPSPIAINCLHGIRLLSMCWVVWGHNYAFELNLAVNPVNAKYVFGDFLDQTIMNAVLSVDTFFFLSGLLVSYSLMRGKDKMDLYKFGMFYIHRILRLLPPIAAMCFFSATVARFFSTGPLGEIVNESNIYRCNSDWFYDVLFINNIAQKWCLEQTWYTSVDMQIYVLLPLIFFPLMFYEKIGPIVTGGINIIHAKFIVVLSNIYNFLINKKLTGWLLQKEWAFFYYFATWSRAGPYMVGLWAGYILYKTNKNPIKMNEWQVALGWVLAVTVGLLVCYGIYPYNKADDNIVPKQELADLYNGFARASWGLALLWVVVACHTGYGGPVNSFLSHPSWQPLSRLTYHMFLVSVTVEALLMGSEFQLGYYDHLTVIIKTCGVLFISGIAATVLSLLTEGPVINLEKLLLVRPETKQNITGSDIFRDD